MRLIAIIATMLFMQSLTAQTMRIDPVNSKMTFYGTSTLHDWHMWAEEYAGTAVINKDDKKVNSISSLTFVIPVKSLKSGKSAMDKNTYNALNEDDHKEIKYVLTSVQSINPSKDGKGYIITATGKLTISGTTLTETFKVYSLVLPDGSVKFIGEVSFPMSKYGVDPPTAVMGTIKTGDDLTFKFSVIYK